jgi:hypothetical protein
VKGENVLKFLQVVELQITLLLILVNLKTEPVPKNQNCHSERSEESHFFIEFLTRLIKVLAILIIKQRM